MGFEKLGLGGELTFEIEKAVQAMTAVSERFQKMSEEAQKANPPINTLEMKLKVLGDAGRKSISQMSSGVKELGKGLAKTLALFTGMSYVMKKGFGYAGAFEQQQGKLAAATGATAEEMQQMSFAAKKLAIESGKAPEASLLMMQNLKASGATFAQTIEAASSAMKLARATGMEEGEAATFLGQTIKTMGLAFEDSTRVIDVMAKTSAKSGIGIEQLGASFRMVGPIARTAGIPFEQLNAALGILSQAGYKGSRAGMGLASMFRALMKPSKSGQEILESWGVSLVDTTGKLMPISYIVTELNKRLSKISNASKRAEIATSLFGRRGEIAFGMLSAAGEKGIADFEKSLFGAAGAADKMIEARGGNALNQMKKFWTSLKTLSGELMEGFLKPVGEIFKSMFKWISSVTMALVEIRNVGLENFVSQAQAAGGHLSTVQEVAIGIFQALEDMKASFDRAILSVKSFGSSFLQSLGIDSVQSASRLVTKVLMIGGILVPIVGTLGAIGWAINKSVIPAFAGMWKMAAGFASLIWSSVIPSISLMGAEMAKVGVMDTFKKLGSSAIGMATSMKGVLFGVFRGLFTFIKGLGGPIFLVIGLIWSYLESTGKKFESFGDLFSSIFTTLKNTIGAFAGGFISKFGDIFDGVKGVVSAIGKMFNSLFGWLWTSNVQAGQQMTSVWGDVGEFIGTVISGILQGFVAMFEFLDEFIGTARTKLEEYMLGVQERTLESERQNMTADEYMKKMNKILFMRSQIQNDTRNRQAEFVKEKDRQKAALDAARAGIETKMAGKRPEDKVNVDVTLDDKRHTSIKNTLCIDGKQVATAISRSQTEVMERSGAKKEAYQKTASREFGVPPGIKKIATLP